MNYAWLSYKHAQQTRDLTMDYEDTAIMIHHFENKLCGTKY